MKLHLALIELFKYSVFWYSWIFHETPQLHAFTYGLQALSTVNYRCGMPPPRGQDDAAKSVASTYRNLNRACCSDMILCKHLECDSSYVYKFLCGLSMLRRFVGIFDTTISYFTNVFAYNLVCPHIDAQHFLSMKALKETKLIDWMKSKRPRARLFLLAHPFNKLRNVSINLCWDSTSNAIAM